MKDYIAERAKEIGNYILEQRTTIRQTAVVFGYSKSTIHTDCRDRLPKINPLLAEKVREVLDYNKSARAIRGGEATRKKYLELRTTLNNQLN
jgi:putative DeoR family transcriptional regulator (stage III sporulation protein D)